MTRRPALWTLVVLFLALAAWLRYGPRPAPEPAPGAPPAALPAFLSIEPVRVRVITVAFSIDTTRIERLEDGWWITSPIRFPADPVAIEALLNRCRTLVPRGVVPMEPGPGDPYGVLDPIVSVVLGLTDRSTVRLDFGRLAPAAGAFYLRVSGRDSLALIAEGEADSYFRRPLDSWRDPQLFDYQPADVTRITLEHPGGRVVLAREADGAPWRVFEPFPGRADDAVVDEFVTSIRAMKARSFPAAFPEGAFGPRSRRIIVRTGGRSDTLHLSDTRLPSQRAEVAARIGGRPWHYGVPDAYLGVADRGDLTFRDRHVLPGPLRGWTRLTLRAASDSIEFAPDSTGIWRQVGDRGTPGAPPPDRTSLVEAWILVEADSLIPAGDRLDPFRPGGRASDRRILAVTDAAGRRREVELAPLAGPDRGWAARVILMDPPRPGEVLILPSDLVTPFESILAGR